MTIRRAGTIIAGAGGGGGANPDDVTIDLNSSQKLQALGTINKNTSSSTGQVFNWVGTLQEYNTQQIETLHPNWVCYVTDDCDPGSSGGLEIGDIGIAPLGIDETQNKRRYLNGQVISQSQFETFTTKLKAAVALHSSLATTEVNWQAAVTNSDLGQCGQFVIDDDAGTIRLPKVVNIQGLIDLTGLGTTIEAGLPNITGEIPLYCEPTSGCYYNESKSNTLQGANVAGLSTIKMSASHSSSIYGNSSTVQPEAVQYPYFIQVAEGIENSVDVSREIELNNPFSLLQYMYSEYEISNASWLLSNGQYNSGATYPAVYDLLLQIYNGTVTKNGVSVKLSTETYDDYDFVLNTGDTTFRLPIKVKLPNSKGVAGNGMTLGITDGSLVGGVYSQSGGQNSGCFQIAQNSYGSEIGTSYSGNPFENDKLIGITSDSSKSGIEVKDDSSIYLYFYVGDTIQDANIIAAASVLTDVANLKAHYIVETYVNGMSWYRVYSDGWCEQGGYGQTGVSVSFLKEFRDRKYSVSSLYATGGSSSAILLDGSNKNTSSMTITATTASSIVVYIYWQACGYIS